MKTPITRLIPAGLLALSPALPAAVQVAASQAQTGGVSDTSPSKVFSGITVADQDAIVVGFSTNRPLSQTTASVELTEAGNPGVVLAAFDEILSVDSGGNEATGQFFLNGLAAGTYDVVLTYAFPGTQTSASTGAGLLVLRGDGGAGVVRFPEDPPVSATAGGIGVQAIDLIHLGLPPGGVFFDTVAANSPLDSDPGGTSVYNAGNGRRTGWQALEGTGGDLTRSYTVDFGDTDDAFVGLASYFVEVVSDTSLTLIDPADLTISPLESSLGVAWSTVAPGATSVTLTASDPSFSPPSAPLTLEGEASVDIDFAAMPATVSLTLDVLDGSSAVIDSRTLDFAKWNFTPFAADFEALSPDPGSFLVGDVGDGLVSLPDPDGTGAAVVAVSGAGSTGTVGVRVLDDSSEQNNYTLFENLLTPADNGASPFVFSWIVKNDGGQNVTLRLGTDRMTNRADRTMYLVPMELVPAADGLFHELAIVVNNTAFTVEYDFGTETGARLGPMKAAIFLDNAFLKGISVSGYPGPGTIDSAGFVSFREGLNDVTIDEFSLSPLAATATTPITDTEITGIILELANNGARLVLNYHYPAGTVDLYESADASTWTPVDGGQNLAQGAFAIEDFTTTGPRYFWVAVPAGESYPNP